MGMRDNENVYEIMRIRTSDSQTHHFQHRHHHPNHHETAQSPLPASITIVLGIIVMIGTTGMISIDDQHDRQHGPAAWSAWHGRFWRGNVSLLLLICFSAAQTPQTRGLVSFASVYDELACKNRESRASVVCIRYANKSPPPPPRWTSPAPAPGRPAALAFSQPLRSAHRRHVVPPGILSPSPPSGRVPQWEVGEVGEVDKVGEADKVGKEK